MDKVPRRYNKMIKDGKIIKNIKKKTEKVGKTVFEKLLVDIKDKKQPQEANNSKITSGRITVSNLFVF